MRRQGPGSVYRFGVPLALLLGYAAAFGAAAFGRALPGFDDHPGQFYRLWHALERGAWPWTWNSGWFGGYPELQFYPPGFFYAGLALRWMTLGQAGPEAIYQALLWITWAAPGATTYALLARLTGSGWASLPGAFLALTLSAGTASGVEGGVHIGMLPARLGVALLPLLALVLARWLEGARAVVWLAVPLVAGLTLTHPTHVPGAAALLALAALAAGRIGGWRAAMPAAAALALAAAWTAFWSLPLVARLEHTRPLAWGRLGPEGLASPLGLVLAALALAAVVAARRPGDRLVAIWPWAMAAVLAVTALVLEPRGVRWLPGHRLADAAGLAAVLGAGLAIARALRRADAARRAPLPATAALAIAGAAALSVVAGGPLVVWPRGQDWPALTAVERGMRLDALWDRLRSGPDRVLFTRSSVPLVYSADWWRPHSHATALTPLRTGRAIVHGTFTHPSPVAALVYRGTARRGAIDTLAERLDGARLFGVALEALDAAALDRLADRLGIGAVVVLDEDLPRLAALESSALFLRTAAAGPFTVFERRTRPALPVQVGANHWRLEVEDGRRRWIPARVTAYPLWRAERAGMPLATRRGEAWDLEIEVDGPGPVDLRYGPGAWETAGVLLSVAGCLAWVGVVLAAWSRPTSPRPAGRLPA